MKRWIHANSEIGRYKGIRYGIEDNADQRYYFVYKGSVTYADTEEELFARIDEVLDDHDEVESATVLDVRSLSYEDVKRMLKKAIIERDQRKIAQLQRSKYYDDVVADIRSAMKISASQDIMLSRK